MKANKRKEKDVMKLLTSDYEIEIKDDMMTEFTVILDGPLDSPYEGVSTTNFQTASPILHASVNVSVTFVKNEYLCTGITIQAKCIYLFCTQSIVIIISQTSFKII